MLPVSAGVPVEDKFCILGAIQVGQIFLKSSFLDTLTRLIQLTHDLFTMTIIMNRIETKLLSAISLVS